MSDLPPELVEEILSRVPALSLKRFRSACKRWNVLFKDQRFSTKHFDRAAKQFLAYMWHKNKFISLTVNLHDNNISAPFIEFKGELGFTAEDIKQVLCHCDSLLLCNTKQEKNRLVVWNPCTGETKFIIPSKHYDKYSMFGLGYKNNKSYRNYKVLRYRSNNDPKDPVVEFEIYEFSSGTWTVLEVTANLLIQSRGVSLKGNTYWLTYDNYLLCFDFSTERLVRLRLPFKDSSWCCAALSIVSEEKISVLHNNFDTFEIEVWMATSDKIDETIVLSWKRFLAVDIYQLSGYLQYKSCLSFVIDEEKKLVVCCDDSIIRYRFWRLCYKSKNKNMVFVIGEYGVYTDIDFGDSVYKSGHAVVFNYTPSLVQIQENAVMLRSGTRNLLIKAIT